MRHVSYDSSRKRREHHRDIGIDSETFGALHLDKLADNRRSCRVKRSVEVATKQRTESSATCARRADCQPMRIARAFGYGIKFALEFVKRVMVAQGSPRQLTDCGNNLHVDGVLGAFAEGGMRMGFVADI